MPSPSSLHLKTLRLPWSMKVAPNIFPSSVLENMTVIPFLSSILPKCLADEE